MPVRLLEDALVDQIAAGEVVERPASVVKELMENALDAGARSIRVQLRSGGRRLVRIVDDGEGMDRHDAMMCLERHATSKIRTLDDLVHVRTLGFRGEAIPSIASVSRFEILTRRHDAEVGTRVRVEGGTLGAVSDAGCAPGTQISVKDLFFNLPVRQAFLRTAPTELGHCVDAVVRQAMLRPDVDVLVTHEGRDAIRAPAATDRAARARALLGKPAESLRPVEVTDRGVRIVGLASPAGVHQSSGKGVYLYVNGRFVRDPVLRRGVREAYQGIVPRGRHPVLVLEVTVDDVDVDVNVHPSKTEVRFRNPRDVAEVVAGGLREALHRHGIRREIADDAFGSRTRRVDPAAIPLPLDALSAHPADDPRFAGLQPERAPEPELPPWLVSEVRGHPGEPPADAGEPKANPESASERPDSPTEPAPLPSQAPQDSPRPQAAQPSPPDDSPTPQSTGHREHTAEPAPTARIGALELLTAVGDGVVVMMSPTTPYAVDLLALRRELLRADLEGGGDPVRLMVPVVVDVGEQVAKRILAALDALEGVGVSLSAFGGGQLALKRVPAELADSDWPALLHTLGSHMVADPGSPLPARATQALIDAVVTPDAALLVELLERGAHLAALPPVARELDAKTIRAWIRSR